jgi:spermidine synthase
LSQLSNNALSDPKVRIHIEDAGRFLERSGEYWDLIVLDLPDPNTLSLGRLYTRSFYRLCAQHLTAYGIAVTQATSPFYAPEAFWCVAETWRRARYGPEREGRFHVYPYHVYVPSFGDWGFIMASRRPLDPRALSLPTSLSLKFLSNELLPTLFAFPGDTLLKEKIRANRLDDQALVKYYRKAWRRFGP